MNQIQIGGTSRSFETERPETLDGASDSAPRILYCHCAYAKVVPAEVKAEVLARLSDSGVAFDAVADLCEMSARKDPALRRIAADPDMKIAACYPRAVQWLFHAAGSELDETRTEVVNMREMEADAVIERLFSTEPPDAQEPAAREPTASNGAPDTPAAPDEEVTP